MNLRYIVPALALATVTAAPAMAADAMPAVSFNGWIDTILTLSDDDTDDVAATAKDEESASIRFFAQASLKANWKVTDALSAKVNLWFDSGNAFNGTDDGATVSGATNVNLREAYFAWALNDTVTWSMGKYIDHIGWLSAEPTGLYTVNASLIGYTFPYGNDVIGTSVAIAPKDAPISGSLHITNGYYTASDASNGAPNDNRENTDLGFGLDVTYVFPNDLGNVNLDFAYDMHSDAYGAAADDDLGGDVLLVGLNATIKPIKPLLIGAEVMYLTLDDGEAGAGGDVENGQDRLQFLALANYAIEGAPVPMSVSAMIQYVTIEFNDPAVTDDEERLGVSVALLTNPLTSSNFGLNVELGFWDVTAADGDPTADNDGINLALEGLVTF